MTTTNREARYRKTKSLKNKQIRQQNKKLKEEGKRKSMNLYFLKYLQNTVGCNNKQLAERIGLSPQMISWWFVSDDTYVSNVEKACDAMGMDIHFSFEKKASVQADTDDERFELRGEVPTTQTTKTIDPSVQARIDKGGRLKPLAELIVDKQVPISVFAENMNSYCTNLRDFLDNDDIKVSKLYMAAQYCNCKLIWTTQPKNK